MVVDFTERIAQEDSGYYLYAQMYLARAEQIREEYPSVLQRIAKVRANTKRKDQINKKARNLEKRSNVKIRGSQCFLFQVLEFYSKKILLYKIIFCLIRIMNISLKLDKIDRKILDILQSNAKITNAQLSKEIGLSPAPTLERVKKLENSGIIKSYHAKLNTDKLV